MGEPLRSQQVKSQPPRSMLLRLKLLGGLLLRSVLLRIKRLGSKALAVIYGAGVIVGLVVVGGVVAPALIQATIAAQPAMADVLQPLQRPNSGGGALANLAKYDGDYFAVQTEAGVATAPESNVVIRKIGYGRTSFVTVTTTASGTYSDDALYSRHVRYPGVHAEQLQVLVPRFGGAVLGWSRLSGWVNIPLVSANSIGLLDDDAVPASRDGVCVTDNETGACR